MNGAHVFHWGGEKLQVQTLFKNAILFLSVHVLSSYRNQLQFKTFLPLIQKAFSTS